MTGAPVQDQPTFTLAFLRAELNRLTQTELARRANLSPVTISNIEIRKWASVEMATAVSIFRALNEIRKEMGMEPLKFREINWGVPVKGSGDLPPL